LPPAQQNEVTLTMKDNMQVVILAGGKGTRLMPLTAHVAKTMALIHDRPFLQHQLEFLKSQGFYRFLLLVGYLKDQILQYFGDGAKFALQIDYSVEPLLLGTGGALKNASDKLDKEFLLLNGDTFLPIDYNALIMFARQNRKIGTMTVYDNADGKMINNTALGLSNRVVDYNKRNPVGMTHVDAGAIVFKKAVLDHITAVSTCSLEQEVFLKLIAQDEMVAFVTEQEFYDIGSFKGLEKLREKLSIKYEYDPKDC
jgi:N-acetyl-alpha-D-muramate 1-phosphate uridylyltransferase